MDKKNYCENVCPSRIKCEVSEINLKKKFQALYDNFNYWSDAESLRSKGCIGVEEYFKQWETYNGRAKIHKDKR